MLDCRIFVASGEFCLHEPVECMYIENWQDCDSSNVNQEANTWLKQCVMDAGVFETIHKFNNLKSCCKVATWSGILF